ncbi:hypothetical protein EV421DRAFT_1741241 [Armillaria borealis]|uniref:Uncharacterized protein n=1 Tax=Armillaria borealis TaxID=47425 RepID=A0AA39MGK2_9AGAR|nr:hypothetical protein EV421DRAFT_2040162 [Armillaria borealis]KAK0434041.1 hypothetical protein EV421DRAFT_1741241 [Armillaria borealis]
MSTLPPELVELIIHDIWHSEMPSWTRQSFMTTCPRINRTWKYAYAHIVSRDIYITNLRYLYYLCDVASCRKSMIYDDLVPRLTRTITCFADLEEYYSPDSAAIRVYNLLIKLPNYIGFRILFPLAEYISLEVKWIGGLRFTDDTEVHGLPFHLGRRRYLSKSAQENKVRMDIYVCITDPDPSSTLYRKSWSSTSFLALNNYCYPGMQLVYWELPYDVDVRGGSLQLRQTLCLHQAKGDLKGVNRYLWMAAQRGHGSRAKLLFK